MPELVIIFSFVIVAALIVFGSVMSMHKRQIAYKERRDAAERADSSANPVASAKKIDQLEQRVRVLERLATDRGQDLAAQIDELRSLPDADLNFATREKVQ
ncbi:hypothetical protein GCM10023115_54670 [Pontixanthobacter gangjinensis]|uniref:Phage shock protein B n=1 Tax=Pontixanthobacter gangjinensis TaxID=1028742 RepID=A0A6I4SS23_9SPHN|nr:hypothetical protein [Pontixanthobacter gangjinensis]MXO57747.1 hypothetical protein [Pontixanthobacter gangjinensis]